MWETVFPSGHVTHQWGQRQRRLSSGGPFGLEIGGFVAENINVDTEGFFSTIEKRICAALFSTQSQSKYQRFVFLKQQECVFVSEASVHGH